jgi:transcription elongation GreA/GreB family factor
LRAGDAIAVGALVELEHGGEKFIYFIGPRAGGTEILHDKKEILVITPQSPLGEQLMGKKSGDQQQSQLRRRETGGEDCQRGIIR